jgi:alpha-L-fucosidase
MFSYAVVFSQTAGDEDKEMFNRGKQRDQQAIDDAVNGWWTASMKTHEQRIAWWRTAKFGMFIHWGVYSLPGGEWKGNKVSGYAEHLMRKEKISRAEYLQIAHQFNPVQFNAEEWILNAKKAGMNYFIITAKHHDGFAMYDSKVSDFNIIQQTPFKRDPMTELAAACKKHGVKFGFYYSHAFDWEHPDAPGNDWEYKNPGGDSGLYGGVNWFNLHPELLPKAVKYVNEKAIPQILELLSKYHPDILWFDTPSKLPLSENIRIMKAIRAADPNVVINGRLARSSAISFGDYKNTADRPAEFYPVTGDWEAIPTTNESYGYHQYDKSHKPVSHFIQLMANAASRGGNLLMNIGPMGNGKMDEKDVTILKGIGQWIDKYKESIYNTKISPLALQSWGVSTLKDNRLYLHVFNWPPDGKLTVGGLTSNISKAYLLTDAAKKKLPVDYFIADVVIGVPTKAPDTSNTVIVLEMNGSIEADSTRLVASNMPTRLLAFDATLDGKGFGFGDGKTARYFVEGWKSKNQSVSWNFRNTEPTVFKVIIKYVATPETAGTYQVKTSEKTFEDKVTPTARGNQVITKELGTVKFNVTTNEINIVPVEIQGAELMKLLEVQLIPVR